MKENKGNPIILKSGATDLRRNEKSLISFIEVNLNGGVKTDTLYGFCNSKRDTLKLFKIEKNGDTMLLKTKTKSVYPWPDYKPKGEEGYTITLNGKDKTKFLKKCNIID